MCIYIPFGWGFTSNRLLEVGAVKPDNYEGIPWIRVKPIDLHSRHPSIEEQDFLLLDEMANTSSWHVISLSLVINFVPQPKDRGKFHLSIVLLSLLKFDDRR